MNSSRRVFPSRSHKEAYKDWFNRCLAEDMGQIGNVVDVVDVDDEVDGQLEDEIPFEGVS